jgi:hypothetical protein
LKAAYIDSSLLIGIRFQKFASTKIHAIRQYELYSSELLIAEVLAFGKREGIEEDFLWESLKGLSWVIPEGSLFEECKRVIQCGYVRGADLWHLACACYLSPDPGELAFLTLEERQRDAAACLGFHTPLFHRE